jgi:hypothetical protein
MNCNLELFGNPGISRFNKFSQNWEEQEQHFDIGKKSYLIEKY